MTCQQVHDRLQDYAVRALDAEERRLVDEHVLKCAECRQELALMSVLIANLDTLPQLAPPPEFALRIMAALPRRSPTLSPWWSVLLIPLLGIPAWLFRAKLAADLLRWTGMSHIDRIPFPQIATFTPGQLGIAAGAVLLCGLIPLVGGLYWGWRYYSESW